MIVTASDVVVELRRRAASAFWTWSGEAALYGRAADEIERLQAEVGRLRAEFERLRPPDAPDLPARLAVAAETCRRHDQTVLAELLDVARDHLNT